MSTLDDLLAANPDIKDPNKIALGQEIVIPTPSAAPPGDVRGAGGVSRAAREARPPG